MGTKKGTKPRKWSKEDKLKLVLLHLNEKVSLMQVEKEYAVSSGLMSTWVKKYLNGGEEALVSRSGNPYAALHTIKSLSEVERVRLIVAKQEIEIARLKKGYWVEGVGANKEYVTGSGKNTKSSKNSR
jgi:transposase-like protein